MATWADRILSTEIAAMKPVFPFKNPERYLPMTAEKASGHDGSIPTLRGSDIYGLFFLSLSLITLEVFQTKVFSYSLSTLLLYCVIGLALIGIGVGGTFVSLLPDFSTRKKRMLALASAFGFSITLIPVHMLFAALVPDLPLVFSGRLVFLSAVLTVPYLFVGIAIALVLSYSGDRLHAAYGANLFGSGAGCFTVFVFLRPLGGEAFIFLVAFLAVLAAWVLARPFRGWARWAAVALAAVIAILSPMATKMIHFPPEKLGQLDMVERLAKKVGVESSIEFDEWDPTGRIQVHSYRNVPGMDSDRRYPYLFYSHDSSAGSYLVERNSGDPGVEKLFVKTLYRQAYYGDRKPDVLIIGLGGGPDILTALHHEARSVVGVEINGAAVRMGLGPMNDILGGAYRDPRVEVFTLDGRSYTASTDRMFDVIQMSGTDTKHLMAAGSLAINECYLYTIEAFRQYFAHLKPQGVISIIRFGPTDTLRLANIAATTLLELGVKSPERNMIILHAGNLSGILIKREPFEAWEIDRIRQIYPEKAPPIVGPQIVFLDAFGLSLAPAPVLDYVPGILARPPFDDFFSAMREGVLDRWLDEAEEDYSATTDAKPFYFDRVKYFSGGFSLAPHMRFIGNTLLILAALALVLIVLPIGVFRIRALATPGIGRDLVYFSSIGLAYMFVEIGFIHHFSIFLGHQTYSFTVVIFSLLMASGLGSLASARIVKNRTARARVTITGIFLLVLVYQFVLPSVVETMIGLGFLLRVLASVAFLAPAGFLMGIPFPTGLHSIRLRAPRVIPWAIGVNGAFSVIAATATVPLTLVAGFPVLMILGAALYLIAALVSRYPDST